MVRSGFVDAIGNTPHIVLPKLSSALGRRIVGKAEYLNPGGHGACGNARPADASAAIVLTRTKRVVLR